MTNALIPMGAGPVTMTSREIADLTGKEHKNVLSDIREMLEGLGLTSADFSADLPDTYGRLQPAFMLPKRESLVLVSGYSVGMRAKIIDRWQQLEGQVAAPALPSYAAALRQLADQVEANERQKLELAAAKPAVEFVERYVQADGLKGFREVCKLLKANEARFREFVLSSRIMYRLGRALTAYQSHIDAGRFEVRAGVAQASDHAYSTTKFTSKGVEWIAGEWGKYQLSHGDAQ